VPFLILLLLTFLLACLSGEESDGKIRFTAVNEVSLIEDTEEGYKLKWLYVGKKSDQNSRKHEQWAKSFRDADSKKFLLFKVTPGNFDKENEFLFDLMKHLELPDNKGIVMGMMPILNDRIVLRGRI